jgi:hypothetical protein
MCSLEIDLIYFFEILSAPSLLLPGQSSLSGCILYWAAAILKGHVEFQNDKF